MEQVPDLTTSILIKRSFIQERLNRMNADPYGTSIRQTNETSAPASERLLNFVKGKFHTAVSTVKKLLDVPRLSSNSIPLLPDHQKQLLIPNDKLNGISSIIHDTISKPEYQQHYDVYNNRPIGNNKASFLNVLSYYKDISADRIREKMEESHSWIIPEPKACPIKPIPTKKAQMGMKTRPVNKKKHPRKGSHSSHNSSIFNLNGKRELHSILSSKEKKLKDRKRVSFKPELLKSTSSIIRYTSSDDEENGMYNEDSTDKRVILQDDSMSSKKDSTLRLSMIAKKKAKINPFQKKNLVEKLSNSQLMKSEKWSKKPDAGRFYMDNSFISDNLLNDSKLETDSDESNIPEPSPEHHNGKAVRESNIDNKKKQDELSDVSEKSSPKMEVASPEKIEETRKLSSPSLENNVIEAQEKEEVMQEKKEDKETKIVPETVEKPQETKGLFSGLTKAPGSLFGPSNTQGLFGLNKPAEKKPLSREDTPEELPDVQVQREKPSLFNNINKQAEITQENTEEASTEKPEPVAEPAKVSYEEALKNPIFANVVSKREDSVQINNNPFLNPTPAPNRGFNSLVSDVIQENNQEAPAPTVENTAPNVAENPSLARNQSFGILGILQSSQSTDGANSIFNNTLKPITGSSWMSSNNEEQGSKNLFSGFGGGLAQLSQPQLSTQGQSSLFGGNMNNDSTMQNTGNSLFNNNSNNNSNAGNSLFGGNGLSSGGGLFGGNSTGGMSTLNQSDVMNSNPFLAGGFGSSNQGGGMGGGFSFDSGKKRNNQRERAF